MTFDSDHVFTKVSGDSWQCANLGISRLAESGLLISFHFFRRARHHLVAVGDASSRLDRVYVVSLLVKSIDIYWISTTRTLLDLLGLRYCYRISYAYRFSK